jgi:AraC-like DNA-binding protein
MLPGQPFVVRVQADILRLGFARSQSIGLVAPALQTSTRSLQRRLASEGTRFSDVREKILREATLAMLKEPGVTREEAALRLGFGSRSGFHRAVHRWTGTSPAAFRRNKPRLAR